jgi:hypothetical protein
VFVKGLEPLAQPLGDLSKGAVTLVETFMGAAKEKHWIEDLSKGLENVSKAINDGSLSETIKSFVDGADQMATKLQYIASRLPGPDTESNLVHSFLGPQQDIDAVTGAYHLAKNMFTPWAPPTTFAERFAGTGGDANRLMGDLIKKGWSKVAAAPSWPVMPVLKADLIPRLSAIMAGLTAWRSGMETVALA